MLTKTTRTSLLIACTAAALITVNLSWYTVDQGYRAIILRNGGLVGVAEPGLGFKWPLIDKVEPISVQENVRIYGGREDHPFESYSSDQQPAKFRISVNYHIPADRVADAYSTFGGEAALIERLLDPRVFQSVKNVFGQFNAAKSIQDRGALNAKMRENLEATVMGAPIVIDGLQVEEIHFSGVYETSVEQRMLAEVEVQKIQQNAAREKVQADITVIKAHATADAARAHAQAESDAIRLRGEAEASASRARAAALGENPNLVLLTQTEKWNGMLPSTMVPGGTVPFIAIGGNSK
jgi:regulator of protease activity HflC (stomatin/prohibitin superfamily)